MRKFYQVNYTHVEEVEEQRGKKEETVIKQKTRRDSVIVQAISCKEAETIALEKKGNLTEVKVVNVKETKIKGVYTLKQSIELEE